MNSSVIVDSSDRVMNKSLVQILLETFDERKQADPKYSLRAYARDLRIEASLLSKILRERYVLTPQMIIRIGTALGLSHAEVTRICTTMKEPTHQKDFDRMDDKTFDAISNWYSFAILRGFDLEGFQDNLPTLHLKLGITSDQVSESVDAFLRLGLLLNLNGRLKRSSRQLSTFPSDNTSMSKIKLQREFLERAICSLDNTSIENRSHTAITFSTNLEVLPLIKEEISRFRKHIGMLVARQTCPDTVVYNLTLSLYPMIEEKKT